MRRIRQGAAPAAHLGRQGAAGLAAAGAVAMLAAPAAAVSLGAMAESATTDLGRMTGLLAILFYLVGAVFVGVGLLKMKRTSEQPQQGSMWGGGAVILVGVALILTPAVVNGVRDMMGASSTESIDRPKL